jgi:hypothetical protein
LLGAGLAYLGARHGSRPEQQAVTQSRRDEWGRRFAEAMTLLTDESPHQRAMGRALIDALLDSDLAQADDRRIAQRMLAAAALSGWPEDVLSTRQMGGQIVSAVDDVAVVEDDETDTSGVQEER